MSKEEDRSPAEVGPQVYVTTCVASDDSEIVAGLAVTLREFPVSGSTALAEGTVRVCPAAAFTAYGLLCGIVIRRRKAEGPIRMHW